MTAFDKEVVARYEDLAMRIEEIAADLTVEPEAVRVSLAQNSAQYRNELRMGESGERQLFEDFAEKQAVRVMQDLLAADDEAVRLRAAKFIIDERKGRNDAAVRGLKAMQNVGISVQQFNEALLRARRQRTLEAAKVIDVQASVPQPEQELVLAK
jgi:predicted nucleic acid-binding protein